MTRYGKCTNIDEDCPKARSGEVIMITGTREFVCPSCHEPLFEVPAPKRKMLLWQKASLIAVGVLALAAGVVWMLCYNTDACGQNAPLIVVNCDSNCTPPKPPSPPILTRGTKIEGSEYCLDCESFYKVADGKGGTFTETEGYNTRCCKCGSKVAFKDGYYYDIVCEDDRIKAVMAGKVE